ncbi:MAG: phosphatase PAP2 family protein [bacterium]
MHSFSRLIKPSLLVIVLLCSVHTSYASDTTSIKRSFFQTIGDDVLIFGEDLGAYVTAPLHYTATNWGQAASILGTTTLLMGADPWGREQAQAASHSSGFQSYMTASRQYGELVIAGGLSGATYLGGLCFNERSLRLTGRELIEGLAYAGVTTTILKIIIGRSRPFTGDGAYSFKPFQISDSRNSLPSGHTTVAFTVSSILARRINNPIATVLLYSAATSTAFSRMYHDKHWLSDTFLGAAIGTTAGFFVTGRDFERDNNTEPKSSSLEITPYFGGIAAQYRF